MPRILMCPPDFYGIDYEINPWMSRQRQSDPTTAQAQWEALHNLLIAAGATIELLAPVEGLARPGLHRQCGADLSRPRGDGPLPPSRAPR